MAADEHDQALPVAAAVRRTGGLLPPGVTKRFDPKCAVGSTFWFGVRFGTFDVVWENARSCRLDYRRWPIVDELRFDGSRWSGAGLLFGRLRFCTFWLDRG